MLSRWDAIHDLHEINFLQPHYLLKGKYWSMTSNGWKKPPLDLQFSTSGFWTLNLAEEAVVWRTRSESVGVIMKRCVGLPWSGERITWDQSRFFKSATLPRIQTKGREGTISGKIKKEDWHCRLEWQVHQWSTPSPCLRPWSDIRRSQIQSRVGTCERGNVQ